MFTGIIEATGSIEDIKYKDNIYVIKTNGKLQDCKIGSSICCDGVCLTIISLKNFEQDYIFEVNIGEETIKRSNLSNWIIGSQINIEKSLRVGDEISGHFVYGHIDLTLNIKKITEQNNSWVFEFSFLDSYETLNPRKFIVEKGSVTINGISLTVANVFADSFSVSVIPHTFQNTNLSILRKGNKVNVEFDPLARYISDKHGN